VSRMLKLYNLDMILAVGYRFKYYLRIIKETQKTLEKKKR